jgi:hypothetical protein
MIRAMRRVALIAVGLALLAPGAADAALPRSTVDRLDEQRGPQIHFVYAVPADGQDRRLDESGALEGSIASFQAWLAAETSGPNLRVDTYQGSLDITFFRLAAPDATLAARGAFVREGVEQELRAAGFDRADRIYAVYYDGSSTTACGGAFWPPQLQGNAVVMYLRGRPPGAFCENNGFAAASAPPTYWEYAMLHDLLHGLGFVATCAPHHHLAGHVSDFANDLMWAGSQPWSFPARLDIGRDDYYGHGRTDCADLARSPYLTSNAPPPPVLNVVRFTATTRATPGRVFDATLAVTVDGAPATTGAARCAAKLGTRALRPIAASFSGSAARCRWRLPATARGKRLTGSVQAVVGQLSAKRTFTRAVR